MQEFKIRAGELLRLVKTAAMVVEKRTTIPILTMVSMRAHVGACIVTGTDLDRELEVVGDLMECANVESPGFCVSPFPIIAIVGALVPDMAVTVRHADGRASFAWAGGSFSLYTLNVADFPLMPVHPMRVSVDLDANFIAALARVSPAISNEETRYYLNGVYLERQQATGTLTPVATDGHRLAAVVTKIELPAEWSGEIVHHRTVKVWPKLFKGAHTLCIHDGKHMSIRAEGLKFRAKLIDGSFPEWRRVVPKDGNRKFVTGRHALMSAAKTAGAVSCARYMGVMISAEKVGDSVHGVVYVSNPDTVDLRMEMGPVSAPEDFGIGINARYLAQALKVVRGHMVALEQASEGSPTVLRGDQDEDGIFVVMPMRVDYQTSPPPRIAA